MDENKGMFDDWSETFKGINAGFSDLAKSIGESQSRAEDLIAAEAENNQMHDDAMESILKNSRYLQELSKIAEAAQKQADLAEAEAEDSAKEAKRARRDANISNIIAFVSMLIAFVALFK